MWKLKLLPAAPRSRLPVEDMVKGLAAVLEGASREEAVQEIYGDHKREIPKHPGQVVKSWEKRIQGDLDRGNKITLELCKGYGIAEELEGRETEALPATCPRNGNGKRRPGRPRRMD